MQGSIVASPRARCLGKGPCSHAVIAEKSFPDCLVRWFEGSHSLCTSFVMCSATPCHVHPPLLFIEAGNNLLFSCSFFDVSCSPPRSLFNSCACFLQGMPDDIAGGYDPAGDMWVSSEDSDTEIKSGCGVRLRIIGVTVGAELVRLKLSGSLYGSILLRRCECFHRSYYLKHKQHSKL